MEKTPIVNPSKVPLFRIISNQELILEELTKQVYTKAEADNPDTPKLAPFQVVIVPIYKTEEQLKLISEKANNIKKALMAKNIHIMGVLSQYFHSCFINFHMFYFCNFTLFISSIF